MVEEILQDAPMAKEIADCPPLSIWSEVAVLLKEWAPPQNWDELEGTPGAVVAIHGIGKSLKKWDARMAVEAVGWLFRTMLRKAVKEKDRLLREA